MISIRRPLLAALVLTAVALADVTGNVNGTAEQPVIDKIGQCILLETQAAGIISNLEPKEAPSEMQNTALDAKLDEAIACIAEAVAAIDAGRAGFQASTDADGAKARLGDASKQDGKAKTATTADKIRVRIDKGIRSKRNAIRLMQGISDAEPDNRTGLHAPSGTTEDAYVFDGSSKKPESTRGWRGDRNGGSSRRGKRPPSSSKKAGPPDYYLAFLGTGPSANGFAFFNMQRELRGPFVAYHTAGFFSASAAAEAALGSAFSCMEFDVAGSSPLEFLSVCGRFTNGGLQAFASARTGSLGQVFLAGARRGTFKTTYDGTTFRCFVKAEGAADSTYQQFATFVRDQGASVKWVAGVGGANLAKKAEVGIDDVVIQAQ